MIVIKKYYDTFIKGFLLYDIKNIGLSKIKKEKKRKKEIKKKTNYF